MKKIYVLLFLLLSSGILAQSGIRITHPAGKNPVAGKWEKFEIGIRPATPIQREIDQFLRYKEGGINPFAEEDLCISGEFRAPSGKVIRRDAFYYQPYKADIGENRWRKDSTSSNFRIRFAPDETGEWLCTVHIRVRGEIIERLSPLSFKVQASESKGHLLLPGKKAANPFVFTTAEDGKGFFAIGENITHSNYIELDPRSHERHKRWLKELADVGGNFVRLEMGAQNFLVDWDDLHDYSSRLPRAAAFDEIVDLCMERGLYFILFNHHVEYEAREEHKNWPDRPVQWDNNPFKKQLGMNNPDEVFSSEKAWHYFKRRYRYLFSRWAYAPQFAIYEFSELDNMFEKLTPGQSKYKTSSTTRALFLNFFLRLKKYIQIELGYNEKMIAVSFASNPDYKILDQHIYTHCDVTFAHKYGERKDENFIHRWSMMEKLRRYFGKPCLMEEMGPADANIYCCSKIQYHNDLWSGAFMGGFGTGLHWWWDRGIHDLSYHKDLIALSRFFEDVDLSDRKYEVRRISDKMSFTLAARRKRTYEVYYLRDEKGDKLYGWVHNATAFWRNETSACIGELIEKKHLSQPCKMEDGAELGCAPPCAAWIDYPGKNYLDDYQKIIELKNLIVEIGGLRMSPVFGKKHQYKIQWYSTEGKGGVFKEELLNSKASGKLRLNVPEMGPGKANDHAFKITWMGLK